MALQLFPGPAVVGGYRLERLLGAGGSGQVYRARRERTGEQVALKVLRDPRALPLLARAMRVHHPNLVRTLKLGSSATASHVVMELLRGSTLREVLAHRTALDVPAAVAVMVPVLAALHAAHAADVCHGDLKPENVVLEPDGAEDVVVKVLDLGGLPPAGEGDAVVGSAGYLSPEQAAGEVVDARSDVFGAGVLLFELVTGRPPFAAATPVATAYQIVHRPAPRVEDVRLAPLLDVAMAKAPADRFATAALFAQALADRVPPAALRDLRVARGA